MQRAIWELQSWIRADIPEKREKLHNKVRRRKSCLACIPENVLEYIRVVWSHRVSMPDHGPQKLHMAQYKFLARPLHIGLKCLHSTHYVGDDCLDLVDSPAKPAAKYASE